MDSMPFSNFSFGSSVPSFGQKSGSKGKKSPPMVQSVPVFSDIPQGNVPVSYLNSPVTPTSKPQESFEDTKDASVLPRPLRVVVKSQDTTEGSVEKEDLQMPAAPKKTRPLIYTPPKDTHIYSPFSNNTPISIRNATQCPEEFMQLSVDDLLAKPSTQRFLNIIMGKAADTFYCALNKNESWSAYMKDAKSFMESKAGQSISSKELEKLNKMPRHTQIWLLNCLDLEVEGGKSRGLFNVPMSDGISLKAEFHYRVSSPTHRQLNMVTVPGLKSYRPILTKLKWLCKHNGLTSQDIATVLSAKSRHELNALLKHWKQEKGIALKPVEERFFIRLATLNQVLECARHNCAMVPAILSVHFLAEDYVTETELLSPKGFMGMMTFKGASTKQVVKKTEARAGRAKVTANILGFMMKQYQKGELKNTLAGEYGLHQFAYRLFQFVVALDKNPLNIEESNVMGASSHYASFFEAFNAEELVVEGTRVLSAHYGVLKPTKRKLDL